MPAKYTRDSAGSSTVYDAVADTPTLDQRDALALADEIVDLLIDALPRDRSFYEWALALAPLRAAIAARINQVTLGRAVLDEVLNAIEATAVGGAR